MNNKKEILEELKDIAPNLSEINKQNPFKAPGNYFNQLPDQMLHAVQQSPKQESWIDHFDANIKRWLSMLFQPKYAVPVAISFLIIVTGINLFKANQSGNDISNVRMTDISTQELNDYLMDNYETDELLALNELKVSEFESALIIPEDISTDDLDEYIFNNIDDQLFEEEL